MRLVQVAGIRTCEWCEYRPGKIEGPTYFGCHMTLCEKCHSLHGVQGSSLSVELTTEPVAHGKTCECMDCYRAEVAEELGVSLQEADLFL